MPAPLATSADRRSILTDGLIYRTCSRCHTEHELTPENFQHRNNWIDARCQDCRRAVDAENRAARRRGEGTRTGRKFGVEIEFVGASYDSVIREMRNRGLTVSFEGYTHRIRQGAWKIVTDGSLARGYELVSPPLSGSAGKRQLKKACEALNAAGATVDRSCGLHVHHDINDLNADQIGRMARLWSNCQGATNGLVASSRRNSRWAAPLPMRYVTSLENLDVAYAGDTRTAVRRLMLERYHALNFACYPAYGTVEVRQHQGTTSAKKILAWVAFGQAMIQFAKSADTLVTEHTTSALVARLSNYGLADSTAAFLQERAVYFAGGRRAVAA